MAKDAAKVMQFVEKSLADNPEITTSELYEAAKEVDAGVEQLSLRQFNARFPLQVKRRKSHAKPGRKRTRKRRGSRLSREVEGRQRDQVRDIFLQFASDLSAAEERKELVKVIAQVDRYVDEAIRASKG